MQVQALLGQDANAHKIFTVLDMLEKHESKSPMTKFCYFQTAPIKKL